MCDLLINLRAVLACVFDHIDALHLFARHISQQVFYAVPNNVFFGKIEHFRVNGFYRQSFRFNH
ncbi:Uncharacterised protein [Vibrio cholerae]|nr:Uncharacterised protein [Vibrio cholerae]CSC69369.1 Uncharacterised protein [Vibrio cholerae]CSI58580.1 Uncharacterised protein [Vibrio cholerae]